MRVVALVPFLDNYFSRGLWGDGDGHAKQIRLLNSQRPMAVVKDMTDKTDMTMPVVVRKGRNTLATICKEASTRKFFDNIIEALKERTSSGQKSRLTCLHCTVYSLICWQCHCVTSTKASVSPDLTFNHSF